MKASCTKLVIASLLSISFGFSESAFTQVVVDPEPTVGDCDGCYRYAEPQHCSIHKSPSPNKCSNAGSCTGYWENGAVIMRCDALNREEEWDNSPYLSVKRSTVGNEAGQKCWTIETKTCIWYFKCGCGTNAANKIVCKGTLESAGAYRPFQDVVYGDHCPSSTGGGGPELPQGPVEVPH